MWYMELRAPCYDSKSSKGFERRGEREMGFEKVGLRLSVAAVRMMCLNVCKGKVIKDCIDEYKE